ncbi:MAG TPA: PHB depolymerase family esterase [Solirubrobacteraceae bacterium]|nr:PHB depolymerase family esterase [Solirubrobacteraceae bacterium]
MALSVRVRARLGGARRAAAAAAFAALALPGCGAAHSAARPGAVAPAPCPGLAAGDHRIEGSWVHVPVGAPSRRALILAFHGVGDRAEPFVRFAGLVRLADRRRLVLAAPEMQPGRSTWQLNRSDGDDDVARIRRLLDGVQARACTDPARVYVTGFSNGAGFATRLACELAARVAAVVAVAGSYRATDACPPRGPRVALMEVHGDADPYFATVPRLLGMWLARDRCPARAVVTHPRPGMTRTAWRGCPVQRVVLHRTGHVWPGARASPLDPTGFRATDAAWAFLSRWRRCGTNVC